MWASDVSLILSEMPTLARGDIGHLHIEEPNNTTMGLCGFPQLQDIIFHLLSIIGASPPPPPLIQLYTYHCWFSPRQRMASFWGTKARNIAIIHQFPPALGAVSSRCLFKVAIFAQKNWCKYDKNMEKCDFNKPIISCKGGTRKIKMEI